MDDFVVTSVKTVLIVIGAVLLAVFAWVPSLYGKLWQLAKDVGFLKTKRN